MWLQLKQSSNFSHISYKESDIELKFLNCHSNGREKYYSPSGIENILARQKVQYVGIGYRCRLFLNIYLSSYSFIKQLFLSISKWISLKKTFCDNFRNLRKSHFSQCTTKIFQQQRRQKRIRFDAPPSPAVSRSVRFTQRMGISTWQTKNKPKRRDHKSPIVKHSRRNRTFYFSDVISWFMPLWDRSFDAGSFLRRHLFVPHPQVSSCVVGFRARI